MRFSFVRMALLVAVSAALQCFAFPVGGPLPPSRAVVAWFALVPMLYAVLSPAVRTARRAVLVGYATGVLWYLTTCYWVYATMHVYGNLPVPAAALALVLMCMYLALYHALFAALLAAVARRGRGMALLAAPFLWVAVELARARVTSFPWNLLGYAQVDNSILTQLAPYTGVYGPSFVLATVNAALAGPLIWPRVKPVAAVALSAALLAGVVQSAGLRQRPAVAQGREKVVLLQPNLDVGSGEQLNVQALATSSTRLTLQAAAADADTVRVVLWPESPSPFQTDREEFTGSVQAMSQELKSPVIAGAIGTAPIPQQQRLAYYNSAALFEPGAGPSQRYDKIHLVPFGEFVPFSGLFRFASGLTQAVGTFDRGTQRTPLVAAGHRYGTFLCYESIFGDEVRQFTKAGADVLVNLSDDGWYGDSSAPFQHLNMARMRAIENHRWVLRDTNTGVTASIAPDGRVVEVMERHRRGAAAMHFNFETSLTFYTRHGDLFAYGCAFVTCILLAVCGFSRRTRSVN